MLVDAEGKLSGIFTDSDLARLFEDRREGALDGPIGRVMTADPLRARTGTLMLDAVSLMAARKISELPVVDDDGRPVGLIDVTDVINMFPEQKSREENTTPANCRIYREPLHGEPA
jgi:arabinose-5-phosphate isomerase